MKILKGILVVIISFLPWTYMFFYRLFMSPFIGEIPAQLTVGVVGAIVLAIGIYTTVKGYGRQAPQVK